ncbi:CCA tRNA nucleotidyltransferase [Agrobacterium rubi]|nr:CCA tRNA nucleotidyltransferase [Agrobacterium rubi]NTF24317.1 CCA tRNA nucleotidyltransferase [Agrobacterium rubi]
MTIKIEIDAPGFRMIEGVLAQAGEESRLVGGCVRDHLLGMDPKDLDIATTAPPDKVMEIFLSRGFKVVPTGLQHGTVTVVHEGEPYEITTLRTDVETDGRHARVAFVTDWRKDAERRDFTINAMSVSADGRLHDYFDGHDDLMSGCVRFVGDADRRITEDYLRILRFFRFRARFGSGNDDDALDAIARHASGLADISVERVWMEMSKIISHPEGYGQVLMMDELGVLQAIGFHGDSRFFSGIRQMRRHTDRPGMILGAMVSGARHAAEVAESWKLSSEDAEDAVLAATTLADFTEDGHYWLSKAVDMKDPQRIVPALKMNRLMAAVAAIENGVPVFPVMGRDLIAAGMRPGPQLGQTLADLKEEWKQSGFILGKDDLLAVYANGGQKPWAS